MLNKRLFYQTQQSYKNQYKNLKNKKLYSTYEYPIQ